MLAVPTTTSDHQRFASTSEASYHEWRKEMTILQLYARFTHGNALSYRHIHVRESGHFATNEIIDEQRWQLEIAVSVGKEAYIATVLVA